MREIKFRGKREDNGEWVYGYYIKENGVCGIMTESKARNFLIWNEVIPESVGQYIERKDIDGKEIYGGDILSAFERVPEAGVFEVVWENASWRYHWHVQGKVEKEIITENPKYLKVIGNIHENKELLK